LFEKKKEQKIKKDLNLNVAKERKKAKYFSGYKEAS
jgi:hypothetical protein